MFTTENATFGWKQPTFDYKHRTVYVYLAGDKHVSKADNVRKMWENQVWFNVLEITLINKITTQQLLNLDQVRPKKWFETIDALETIIMRKYT